MKRKLTGAVLTMLVAAFAAGCGSDGGGSAKTTASSGAPLTKAAFVIAANKICAQTTAKISTAAAKFRDAIAKKTGTLAVPDVVSFYKRTSLPAYDEMLNELNDLVPPKADQKAIDGYVAALAGGIDTVKADPAKFSTQNSPDAFADANARAKKYGLDCVS
jgi:ABC-type glycerol-3-phosphate transport system substrate-binding protein